MTGAPIRQNSGPARTVACIVNGAAGSSECAAAINRIRALFEAQGCDLSLIVAEKGAEGPGEMPVTYTALAVVSPSAVCRTSPTTPTMVYQSPSGSPNRSRCPIGSPPGNAACAKASLTTTARGLPARSCWCSSRPVRRGMPMASK